MGAASSDEGSVDATGVGGRVSRSIGALVWEAKTIAAQYPLVAIPLARIRGHGELPGPNTDLAMDAFVRSGLSFAVAAFRLAQEPRATSIAHHAHMPATLIRAAQRGIPAMLLVRAPKDAVLSYVIKTPSVSIDAGLRGYARFHRPLLPYLDRIVVASFEEVTTNFGEVIERINARFGTAFHPFRPTEANLARIGREIEDDWRSRPDTDDGRERGIPRPSEVRARRKRELERVYEESATSPAALDAQELYRRLDGLAMNR